MASSQAGTIRYISNKPELDEFYGQVEFGLAQTKSGDMSNNAEVVINLPVSDKIALRANYYDVNRGGYIDNVYGEFSIDPEQNPDSNVGLEGANYQSATNESLVEENFNDASYRGFRVSALALIDEYWTLHAAHLSQQIVTDGVFDFDPDIGDLEVSRYYPR